MPYHHDALSFAMAELPKREQACPTFDTLYTLTKKLEAGQLACTHRYTPSSNVYRKKHRHYPTPAGRVAALEEQGLVILSLGRRVRGRSGRWPQCVLGSGDELLPERRAEVFHVWVTWPFC